MKRIRIIANCPPDKEYGCSDISKYIGQEFEVVEDLSSSGDGEVWIDFGYDILAVYPGEYEIIE
jgi:hypothetical protein